jgi:hypothetical protein
MVRFVALDFVLWSVCTRMVSIAFDLEFTSMYAYDRAVDTPSLGIPAYAIMDLEGLRHDRSIRCRQRTAKEAVLALGERHQHPTGTLPVGSTKSQFLGNTRFWFRHRALRSIGT